MLASSIYFADHMDMSAPGKGLHGVTDLFERCKELLHGLPGHPCSCGIVEGPDGAIQGPPDGDEPPLGSPQPHLFVHRVERGLHLEEQAACLLLEVDMV